MLAQARGVPTYFLVEIIQLINEIMKPIHRIIDVFHMILSLCVFSKDYIYIYILQEEGGIETYSIHRRASATFTMMTCPLESPGKYPPMYFDNCSP